MNPRASMPATLSTTTRPTSSRPAAASASTTATKAPWSASSGEMSLNTTPGLGKSGTSRTRETQPGLPSSGISACRACCATGGWAGPAWPRCCSSPARRRVGRSRGGDRRGAAATRRDRRRLRQSSASSSTRRLGEPAAAAAGQAAAAGDRPVDAATAGSTVGVGVQRLLLGDVRCPVGHPLRLGDHRGLAHLELREQRRRDEDRGVRPGGHPDEQRERQVLERPGAELERADVQDRADRQQRGERGVDRPDQGLVDREVGASA